MTWTPDALAVAYDERLLDWQLGPGHPTDPVRARLAVETLLADHPGTAVEPVHRRYDDELLLVHTRAYVDATLRDGLNREWSGSRPDLGAVAAHMFAATVQLVHAVEDGRVRVGFSPQGAKHHAHADHGSGFCVFNDMAWAARHLSARGRRVLYVDLDAHHGDGVEALTRDDPRVMTCSVHDRSIFPGTGHADSPDEHVHNHPLPAGSGDAELLEALAVVLDRATAWAPDVLLVAIGADGHRTDPLSTLQYSLEGYTTAGARLGAWAGRLGLPVLMGGAGGYQPTTVTPQVWAAFAGTLHAAHALGRTHTAERSSNHGPAARLSQAAAPGG